MNKFFSKFNLRGLLYNRKFTISVSIILSVTIWFTILINRNPIRERVFSNMTAEVNISTALKNMGLDLSSDPSTQKFTVTVSGPNYVISTMKADDIALVVSTKDITEAGQYHLSVSGVSNSDKTGYEFVSIEPKTIKVSVDTFDTKEYDVIPKLVGVETPVNKDLIAEQPEISNSDNRKISIKGPRSLMQKIATVEAYYEVNQSLTSTENFECEIRLLNQGGAVLYRYGADNKIYDSNNRIVQKNYLQLDFTSVVVTQPIFKEKTLDVVAQFSNIPSAYGKGNRLNDKSLWSCDYKKVTVQGVPDVIDSMDEVVLSPIDFRKISKSSNSFEVSPILPDGVSLSNSNPVEFFTVKFDVSSFSSKEYSFDTSHISFINVPDDYKAVAKEGVSGVYICGDKNLIQKLKNPSIKVDLQGYSSGTFNISNETNYSTITLDGIDNAWIITSFKVKVTLTKK